MDSFPNLNHMPHVILGKIVDNNFQVLQTLRKVCRDIRVNMDDMKLEANLKSIDLTVMTDVVFVKYEKVAPQTVNPQINTRNLLFYNWRDDGKYKIEYWKHEKDGEAGCRVSYQKKSKILENQHFLDTLFKDLEHILSYQTSSLQKLNFNWNFPEEDKRSQENEFLESTIHPFLEHFKSFLKSRKSKLKLEKLTMTAWDQSDIMAILPYLDTNSNSKALKALEMNRPKSKPQFYSLHVLERNIEFGEIVQLEQIKNMENLEMPGFLITVHVPIQHFIHLSTLSICVKSIRRSELQLLKETFLQCSIPQKYTIKYWNFDELEEFIDWMRPRVANDNQNLAAVHLNQDRDGDWYFRIPKSDQVLQVLLCEFTRYIDFSRVKRSSLHANLRIQD